MFPYNKEHVLAVTVFLVGEGLPLKLLNSMVSVASAVASQGQFMVSSTTTSTRAGLSLVLAWWLVENLESS